MKSKESDVSSNGDVLLAKNEALDPLILEETDIVWWVGSVWSSTEDINWIADQSH